METDAPRREQYARAGFSLSAGCVAASARASSTAMAKSARGALKPRGRDRLARAFAERVRTTARLNAFGAKTRATWEKISNRDFFPAKILPGAKTSRVFSAIRTCAPTPRPARSKPPAPRRALFSSDALVTVHRRTPRLARGRPQRRRVRGSSKRRPKKRGLRRTRRAPPRVPSTSSPPHVMLRVLRACASGIRVQEAWRQARHPLSRRARRPPGPARWPLRDILFSVLPT